MNKKLKLILAVVLSLTMIIGSSITSFAATVTLQNPNTTGVQLVGDTLMIQEDHHNFFVWGKSVMIQCPGVTDILPNNITNMMDIQFNGNLYKGIKEVLIVSTPGKDDKVRLEEGSMIITGINTPEQIQRIKTAIISQPNTLTELRTALTSASKDLSVTKNYIVGKGNKIQNEAGSSVAKKYLQGTAELVTDEEVAQAVVEETKPSSSESKPAEEKKDPEPDPDPTPTPPPTPTPVCSLASTHSSLHRWQYCPECEYPGTVSCNFHLDPNDNEKCICNCGQWSYHIYDTTTGHCVRCNTPCNRCGADASTIPTGTRCDWCGLEGTGAPSCQVDHTLYCPDWTCSECHQPGTGVHAYYYGSCWSCYRPCPDCSSFCPGLTCACGETGKGEHSYTYMDNDRHRCVYCSTDVKSHSYDDGYCATCSHTCTHDGATTGTCEHCGKSL